MSLQVKKTNKSISKPVKTTTLNTTFTNTLLGHRKCPNIFIFTKYPQIAKTLNWNFSQNWKTNETSIRFFFCFVFKLLKWILNENSVEKILCFRHAFDYFWNSRRIGIRLISFSGKIRNSFHFSDKSEEGRFSDILQ